MDKEFEQELSVLRRYGLKTNPLRLEYEREVRGLSALRETLFANGEPKEQIARVLHERRRELGRAYKNAAPPLFREYIFYATEKKYGDPLGPDYESLRKRRSVDDIIESAARPIEDLDDRLTIEGFAEWYRQTHGEERSCVRREKEKS